jgi:hypothetical protein
VHQHDVGPVERSIEIERSGIVAIGHQAGIVAVKIEDRLIPMLLEEVLQTPGVARLVRFDLVSAATELVNDTAQEMGVPMIPVGHERMVEEDELQRPLLAALLRRGAAGDPDHPRRAATACRPVQKRALCRRTATPLLLRATRKELSVKVRVGCAELLASVARSPLARRTLQPPELVTIAAQPVDRCGKRSGIARIEEERSPLPQLAHGVDVGHDERRSCRCRFQRRKTEWLVERRMEKDRRPPVPLPHLIGSEPTEKPDISVFAFSPGQVQGPVELPGSRTGYPEILRFVPEPACGKYERLLCRCLTRGCSDAVVDHGAGRREAVVALYRGEHRPGRSYDNAGPVEPLLDPHTVFAPLLRRILAMNGMPPGEYTRVGNDDRRGVPVERAMTVAVEVDQIGPELFFELQQPLAGAIDIVPRVVHPFERVIALDDLDVGEGGNLPPLSSGEALAHRDDHELVTARGECSCQLHRIGPDSADGVGGHQNSSDSGSSIPTVHKSRRALQQWPSAAPPRG